jgi:dsDNA-binding SOS-regulon protein
LFWFKGTSQLAFLCDDKATSELFDVTEDKLDELRRSILASCLNDDEDERAGIAQFLLDNDDARLLVLGNSVSEALPAFL